MRVICITHATGERTVKHLFSGLTEQGRTHITRTATLFRKRPDNINNLKIQKILSSPHARCIETVVLFARGVSGYTQDDPERCPQVSPEIRTDDKLMEETLTADILTRIVKDIKVEAVLLGVHNNLFKALPRSIQEALKDWVDKDQFFKPRPVVVSLKYDEGDWELVYCAAITGDGEEERP
jgi:phosphohistidine phosphatase SixA